MQEVIENRAFHCNTQGLDESKQGAMKIQPKRAISGKGKPVGPPGWSHSARQLTAPLQGGNQRLASTYLGVLPFIFAVRVPSANLKKFRAAGSWCCFSCWE